MKNISTMKNKKIGIVLTLVVLLTTLSLSGCIGEDDIQSVSVIGSSTVLPIAQMAAEEFNLANTNIRVSVGGGGSGIGINAIIEGTADIGMASRDIRPSEIENVPNVREFTVGIDGLAIIVSKTIYDEGITDLSIQQVKDIYSGVITNWQELGGPDEDIFVVERVETSGTYGSFMEFLDLENTVEQSKQDENAGVKNVVGNTDYSIGYVGMGYVGGNTPAVRLEGYEPTMENILNGNYPLQRGLHFYTNGEPTGAVKQYIDFVLSARGQEIVEEIGFIPVNA